MRYHYDRTDAAHFSPPCRSRHATPAENRARSTRIWRTSGCAVAFCFPDTYEIGMSNLGMRILYGVMNGMDGVWCERVFAPWGDMEQAMRDNSLPLWALESQTPSGTST